MKKKNYKVSAPGKLIISGEHSVVYGYPAIAAATDWRLTIDKDGKIGSNVPIGSGMGSSAAYAVATSAFKLQKIELEKINDMAYRMEKRLHGNPSGVDNNVVTYGGLLWYRKENENFRTMRQIINKTKLPKLYLYNSGKPVETTREMVEYVAGIRRSRKMYVDGIFKRMEDVSREFLGFLIGSGHDFGKLMQENEELLEKLGVVSKSTMETVRQIEKSGGYAKISGAGGRKGGSGMVLIYHPNSGKLKSFAIKNKLTIVPVKLGEEGVRIEK